MKIANLVGICLSSTMALPPAEAGTYWAKQYGTSQWEGLSTALQTNDGGFIAGGAAYDAKTDRQYAWVMKLGASGSVIWQNRFGSKTHTLGVAAVLPMADNGFFVFGNATLLPDQDEVSHYFIKLDSNGKIKVQKSVKVNGLSMLTWAGRQTSDGGCIVTGQMMDSANDNYVTGYVMKIQPAGTLEWFREYDNGRGCGFFMGDQAPDVGYIVAGYLAASSRENDVDAWLIKTDASGNIHWQKRYGARVGFDLFASARPTTDGGYIAAGMYAYNGDATNAGCGSAALGLGLS
ncbi:MAG: hypothetical protein HYX75_04565 [Acidobacteria bacterium]|nr:hypothetical protein [Acidobacteriota bacterium]